MLQDHLVPPVVLDASAVALPSVRTELDRLEDTLEGLGSWVQTQRRVVQSAQQSTAVSRESRMDQARRLDALKRSQAALLERLDTTMAASHGVLGPRGTTRVLIAHRSAWMREKLTAGMQAHGLEVVDVLDDGADALGAVIAEQPDLLVVEDLLPSLQGLEVVQTVREVARRTLVAAHVADSTGVGSMLEAGAGAVFTRRIPPRQVCDDLVRHLASSSRSPLLVL